MIGVRADFSQFTNDQDLVVKIIKLSTGIPKNRNIPDVCYIRYHGS